MHDVTERIPGNFKYSIRIPAGFVQAVCGMPWTAMTRSIPPGLATCLGWCLLMWSSITVGATEPVFKGWMLSNQFHGEGGTFADYNHDGKGDVAVGPFIYWGPEFEDKSRFYASEAFDPVGYSKNFLMFSDDVDGDQWADIVVIGFPGEPSWWYENPGSEAADQLWQQHVILESVDNESPLIADVDGDGKQDLVCSTGGHYGFASHAGQDPRQPWKFHRISPNNGYQRFTHGLGIGDVNNDGHQDLLEKDGWWQNPGKVEDSTAGDEEQFWAFHAFPFSPGGGSQMYAVDFDGDGANEVLTGLAAHGFGLVVYKPLNPEATRFERIDIMTDAATTSPSGVAVSQLHGVAVADMNGDEIPDIVTGKRWWAHANHDPGNSQPAVLLWLECQRQNGRVRFVPHMIDINSGVGCQVTAGDVNGDGLPDVVSGNKRGAFVFLQESPSKDAKLSSEELSESDSLMQLIASETVAIEDSLGGYRPAFSSERALNLDFESGDSGDWEIRGPIAKGAVVKLPADGESDAADDGQATTIGLGSFQFSSGNEQDLQAIGEAVSRPFRLRHPQLSFLVAGSDQSQTRVELVSAVSGSSVCSSTGKGLKGLQRVYLDAAAAVGQVVRIRIIDHANDGYIQADDFRLHQP